jgi:AcrR family transcriptional regulator
VSSRPDQPTKRRRVSRGTLNPDAIVKAAITLLDASGLEALTIARLADDLGTRPMSLYTHFRDKDAILQAVASELFGRFEMPEPNSSDIETLREIMRAYFRLLIAHPALMWIDAADQINPAETRVIEAIYRCLQHLQFDHRTAVGLAATMLRFVLGCAFVYPRRHAWDEDPEFWGRVRRVWAALPPETYPSLHDLSQDMPAYTQIEAFEFGLDALLAGVAATAGKPGDGDSQTSKRA